MRIVIDYRPALRNRSGVGEYVHQLACALRDQCPHDELTLFTSSWSDRATPQIRSDVHGARVSDHRIPVRVLNLAWHNFEWPHVESLIGQSCDVAFSPHPLLLPARRAAQVVMVHDLDFLNHPERTYREIRRDYPRLAGPHARRARRVIVNSAYTAVEVSRALDVPMDHIAVCPPGVPDWPSPLRGFKHDGYLLFVGTAEPRKNIEGLLAAYRRLLAGDQTVPKLLMAGRVGSEAHNVLAPLEWPPLAGRVRHIGYVPDQRRQDIYLGARALVMVSFEEGFGMTALEAMSLGIPVIASARGGLPELLGDAGLFVEPTDHEGIADAMARIVSDDALARDLASRGLARARHYCWRRTAQAVRQVFAHAAQSGNRPVSHSRSHPIME